MTIQKTFQSGLRWSLAAGTVLVTMGMMWAGDMAVVTSAAATPERIVVPLGDPSKPATIHVDLINGGITVEGYGGKEVVVEARQRVAREHDDDADHDSDRDEAVRDGVEGALRSSSGDRDERGDRKARSAGMRRIPNESMGLTVEANGNNVRVNAESWRFTMDIKLLVPVGSSLRLGCINDGDILVTGVQGALELSNVNGGITVRDAAAQVVADTTNGEIEVAFASWHGDKPMAFSTLNGDVDVTLPASLKANVVLRSDNGEIYSDFELALESEAAQVRERRGEGRYRVEIEKAVRGAIGGGGPEILFKTFNGDIYLRRGR